MGCKCFILNNGKTHLSKFDSTSDEGIILGYSLTSKAYRVYNKRSCKIEEYIHVRFDQYAPMPITNIVDEITCLIDKLFISKEEENILDAPSNKEVEISIPIEEPILHDNLPKSWKTIHGHSMENIIGDVSKGVSTRSSLINFCSTFSFASQIEPKSYSEAKNDENWINAMHEELNQFERNKVWKLVPKPENHSIIGTKWVFRNKLDENGIIVRNKSRLVEQGYNQEEGIDYDETFALVARLEAIRILLAYASYMNFKLFQIDVKSAF